MRSLRSAGVCLLALLACVTAVSIDHAPTREPTPAFEVPAVDVSTANTATVPTAPVDASLLSVEEKVLAQTAVKVEGNDPLAPYVVIPPFTCKQNTILADGTIIAPTQAFTYSFWIRPTKIQGPWTNVFHYGEGGARTPSIFLYPNSLRLHVRIATSRGGNDGADPVHQLKLNRWNYVAVVIQSGRIEVYVNKHSPLVATIGVPNVKSARLFGSDPWHTPAAADIKDFRYFARALPAASIRQLYLVHGDDAHDLGDVTPGPGRVVAQPSDIERPTGNAYTYAFWIFPRGVDHNWMNILHHGNQNIERSPALWFYPGQPRIHFRVSTVASWNEGVDPAEYLPMGRWTHVAFSARNGLMQVYYNGVLKAQAGIHTPVYHSAVTYSSDPWHSEGKFLLKNLKYYTRFLNPSEVRTVMLDSTPMSYRDFGAVEPRHANSIADTGSLRKAKTYSYTFWIRPHSAIGAWGSVLHRGDQVNQATPGVQMQAGTTRLVVTAFATGTAGSINPAQPLPHHKWTHVAITVRGGELKVFYNGVVVGRQEIGAPVVHDGRLWVGNPWQQVAQCSLADLRVYTKVLDNAAVTRIFNERRNEASFRQVPTFPLVRARMLASPQQMAPSDAFSYTFWIKPNGLEHNWGNIFHHGNNDLQRNPGIWFFPGNTRLHIRISSVNNWNDGVDTAPHQALPFGRWSHVAISAQRGDLRVFINGELVNHYAIGHINHFDAPLFASHRDYFNSKSEIRDFRHYTRVVHQNEVQQIMAANRGAPFVDLGSFIPVQGQGLATPATISHHGRIHSYSYSFWIRVHGVIGAWSNVFHHGSHNMERSPAVFIYPGSTRLHIRTSSPRDRNHGVDPVHHLPMGQFVHIAIVVSQSEISVFWDGQRAGSASTDGVHMDWGTFFVSDPWHHAAQCTVANLRYYPNKLLSEAEVKVIARDRASTGPAFRLVGPHTLTPGAVLAQPQQIPSADSYTWAFWVKPRGVPTHWGSILHHGEFNHERSPAIWFIPGTLRLHVRVATQFDHNNGIDTPVDMRVNRWTHVAVVARERDLWVYYDGVLVAHRHFPFRLVCHTARTYSTDPWHGPMVGALADVRYYPRPLSQHEVAAVRNEFSGVPYLDLGSFVPRWNLVLSNTGAVPAVVPYSYSFWLRLENRFPHWTNVFHQGTHNGQRTPAIFVYPGQTRLHIRTGDSSDWNNGVDPDLQLNLNQWYHIAIIVSSNRVQVTYDASRTWTNSLNNAVSGPAPHFGSDPWHHPALGNVANLRFYPRELSAAEVTGIRNANYVRPSIFIPRHVHVQQHRAVANANQVISGEEFTYSFWVYPYNMNGAWRNIIHHGHHDGQRSPAIWFFPGNFNLHVRVSTVSNSNDGIDVGTHGIIWYHRWSHVAVTVGRGILNVYVDGVLRAHRSNLPQLALHHAPLWASNPWYHPAFSLISDLRHYKYALTQGEVAQVVQARIL